jgi:hypothetical protein
MAILSDSGTVEKQKLSMVTSILPVLMNKVICDMRFITVEMP